MVTTIWEWDGHLVSLHAHGHARVAGGVAMRLPIGPLTKEACRAIIMGWSLGWAWNVPLDPHLAMAARMVMGGSPWILICGTARVGRGIGRGGEVRGEARHCHRRGIHKECAHRHMRVRVLVARRGLPFKLHVDAYGWAWHGHREDGSSDGHLMAIISML